MEETKNNAQDIIDSIDYNDNHIDKSIIDVCVTVSLRRDRK